MQVKMHWVHTEYWRMGPEGNNIHKTNVPALRMRFRCVAGRQAAACAYLCVYQGHQRRCSACEAGSTAVVGLQLASDAWMCVRVVRPGWTRVPVTPVACALPGAP